MAEYARPSGMGQLLVDNIKAPEVAVAVLLPLVLSGATVVFGQGLLLVLVCTVATLVAELSVVMLTRWLKKKLGGITGDTHGMVCEVSQMVFAFMVYALIQVL